MTPGTQVKYHKLQDHLTRLGRVAVAFSGGVDSTFLCKVARDVLGEGALAITAVSETLAGEELAAAKRLAQEIGIRHVVVEARELDDAEFRANPPDRCYHCKKVRFTILRRVADEMGFPVLAEGANADDLSDYRPGLVASEEMSVVRPLLEAGLAKSEIRELSRELGLSTWDKPAMACLASRIPYGTPITAGKLGEIELAERYLRELGFRVVRVRHHGNLARIEVGAEERAALLSRADEIDQRLKTTGFKFVTLDLAGYRTGSLNAELNLPSGGRES